MYVQKQTNWELCYMYGNDITGVVNIGFTSCQSGEVANFSVSLPDAEDFYRELGLRIHQAGGGKNNG